MNKTKQMMVAVIATAIALLTNAVFAASLDLGGVARTVTDVSELAAYDGVTNSSGGDPATLTFDVATDMAYAGTISGNIKVVKEGTGMLDLSGSNTYTGGTVINQGRLMASSLTAFGSTSGAIAVNSDCQQSSMDSNKVTCVVFNAAGEFAYPINTSEWTNPSARPSGEGGLRQYNVAVTTDGVTLAGKITGGGLSVHFGGLDWPTDTNPGMVAGTTTISGEIYCPNGTCHFGSRASTINVTGKVTALGIYQVTGSVWPPSWSLSNTGNTIGVIDVGGGSRYDRSLTVSGANALGGATIYSSSANIGASRSVKIAADQTVESFSMNPSGTYAGGSLPPGIDGQMHYIEATAAATVTMLGTNNRTNDWWFKDGGAAKAMSIVWCPVGDYTYTCVGHTNTMHGTITVSGGTFEVGDSCSFPNVSAVSIAIGATLKVSSADVPFSSSVAIEAESGATLVLAEDIAVGTVRVGGQYLSAKDFSAGTYRGLTIAGEGTLYVSSRPGVEGIYTWVGGGDDDNITTPGNWQSYAVPDFGSESPFIVFAGGATAVLDCDVTASGIAFDGVADFELSALDDNLIKLGAGGISNAPSATVRSVTVSAPVMPMFDQVWQMETNTTFTLSGVLKRFGPSTPTITFRQGSFADPTISIAGAATAEAASDFAGDIVFEETPLSGNKYGTAHVRASGYEPFGLGGTLMLRGRDEGHMRDTNAREAKLFLANAVISKEVEYGKYYATFFCAEDNTTNVMNGAFKPYRLDPKSGTFPPEFDVGANAVLRLCGDVDFGTRNNSASADVALSSLASTVTDMPSGKIVFDGRITRMPLRMNRKYPVGLEFNAAENAITNLFLRADSIEKDRAPSFVRFGASYALSNGQAMVTFPKGGLDLRSVDFDLNGTVQHILGFEANMSTATRISSSSGAGTLRISQPSDVVFDGYVATNVTIQMEGTATLTFTNSTAFRAGSTLAVSNGTVAVSNASALNEDVTLKLMGGKISIPSGQTARVGEAYYLDGGGNIKPLLRGTYSPGDSTIGSFFASGSGSIRVTKGESSGFLLFVR